MQMPSISMLVHKRENRLSCQSKQFKNLQKFSSSSSFASVPLAVATVAKKGQEQIVLLNVQFFFGFHHIVLLRQLRQPKAQIEFNFSDLQNNGKLLVFALNQCLSLYHTHKYLLNLCNLQCDVLKSKQMEMNVFRRFCSCSAMFVVIVIDIFAAVIIKCSTTTKMKFPI